MESVKQLLTEIINEQGMEYLQREPYEVYGRLISAGAEKASARLVLITLLAGAAAKAFEVNAEMLSKDIQKESSDDSVRSIFCSSLVTFQLAD